MPRRRNRRDEMVPDAEFRSYYGQPVIKPPIWHEPHMPVYLYLGGMSGAASAMAAVAMLAGRDRLALSARLTASAAGTAGAAVLIAELGRPERFLNMLRLFKPTSPMSVGSWTLAAQGGLTSVSAACAVTGLLPGIEGAATIAGGVTGSVMSTYTAVLLADTAVPAWHEAMRELPFLFAGSAVASAGAMVMLSAPRAQAAPARTMAALGAAIETAAGAAMERRLGPLGEPYRTGRAGKLMRSSRALTVAGGLLALIGGRSRTLTALSGIAITAGALCTRFGVLAAGRASANDPRYTVMPQRKRVEAGQRATMPSDGSSDANPAVAPAATSDATGRTAGAPEGSGGRQAQADRP